MSGHSKWHNIQARKGKQDAIKSNVFSKFAKQIAIVAKQGGGDMSANFSLRLLVEKAKISGMPKDNIERAIKRGIGVGADAAQMEEVLYEAFGPGGTAILIKAITDNKNRASAEVKHIVSIHGGNVGGAGSVQWMFGQYGVVEFDKVQLSEKKIDWEAVQLGLIEAGAEDFVEDDKVIEVLSKVENLQIVLEKARACGIEPSESGIQWIAKEKKAVDESTAAALEKLFAELDENDDVDDYWTNAQ